MAGAFPISNSKFSTLGINSVQNTLTSRSINGRKLSRTVDNQRFGFTAQIITSTKNDVYGELMAFILKQRSQKENFTIVPPESSTKGTENGTVLVNGTQNAGDTTITMDGFSGDGANRFKTGDFIKFASHTKVYMVIENVTSSSNAATVTIEPALIENITNDSVVTYNNVPFTVFLTNDVQEFGTVGADKDGNVLYQFELDVEEFL